MLYLLLPLLWPITGPIKLFSTIMDWATGSTAVPENVLAFWEKIVGFLPNAF